MLLGIHAYYTASTQGIEYILCYPNSLNIIIVGKNLVLLNILHTILLVHRG